MEWVETTAKTVEDAKELALDQLGVMADEAEFEILEEPRPGLFGRLRGEARVRARVRPAAVRPKQQRRGREGGRGGGDRRRDNRRPRNGGSGGSGGQKAGAASAASTTQTVASSDDADAPVASESESQPVDAKASESRASASERRAAEVNGPAVAEVSKAAEDFVSGLADAFGFDTTTNTKVEGNEIEVAVEGEGLGLLVGPGGRTLLAIQDLTRVAAQRRLGDHDTRLRVDVAGYRERRRRALERFAAQVAETVRETGSPRALDPMPSADRKIVHDVLTGIEGVTSWSEGEEPNRRIVVVPA